MPSSAKRPKAATGFSDLKLIDELIVDLRASRGTTLEELELYDSVGRAAIQRLREAWVSGEMPVITTSLATYFGSIVLIKPKRRAGRRKA